MDQRWKDHSSSKTIEWSSCTSYLHNTPNYKSYQVPENITKNGCVWGTWVTFAQKIEAIACKVGKWEDPMELFRSKDFLAMYKHPDYYEASILDFLVNKRYTLAQKEIALHAAADSRLWEKAYQLYKLRKLDLTVLELVFKIGLSAYQDYTNVPPTNPIKTFHPAHYKFFEQITQELPTTSSLYKHLQTIVANDFPATWCKYCIAHDNMRKRYCTENLPFFEIIAQAVREVQFYTMNQLDSSLVVLDTVPYFLMVMEHPHYYYYSHFGFFSSPIDGIGMLREKQYTQEEKKMAIFGMSQLGVFNESGITVSFIEECCRWYQEGVLFLPHLSELFLCSFSTHYKYPFFILDYKKKFVQDALDHFMEYPIIPDGLKEVAYKIKNGTLATKEEMAYMEGYRQFRKTYFTLYETIPPREDVG